MESWTPTTVKRHGTLMTSLRIKRGNRFFTMENIMSIKDCVRSIKDGVRSLKESKICSWLNVKVSYYFFFNKWIVRKFLMSKIWRNKELNLKKCFHSSSSNLSFSPPTPCETNICLNCKRDQKSECLFFYCSNSMWMIHRK